jgi:hypothetical protein
MAGAIEAPNRVTPNIHARTNAWKQLGDRWLRATYTTEAGDVVVVTITLRRRGPEAVRDADLV